MPLVAWAHRADPVPARMTRRAAAVALLLVLFAGCGEDGDDGADGPFVTEVVDGDTIEVDLPDGGSERVRIVGVNAPERGECLADEATDWMEDRIDREVVELVRDTSDRDQHGRLLRYVEIGGVDVGEELVRAGLAIARRYEPDTARHEVYRAAQRVAEAETVGVWAADSCGEPVAGADAVVIDEIRFDAEGADHENPNDEWVRIANRGDRPVDLSGWVLKDESASHRYAFPSGFVLDAGAAVTVRTGCGNDTTSDLHWCVTGSAVWNNSGDTTFLLDPAGNRVASRSGP